MFILWYSLITFPELVRDKMLYCKTQISRNLQFSIYIVPKTQQASLHLCCQWISAISKRHDNIVVSWLRDFLRLCVRSDIESDFGSCSIFYLIIQILLPKKLLFPPIISRTKGKPYLIIYYGYRYNLQTCFFRICCRSLLGMGSANERWRYIVTSALIGCAHDQHDPWGCHDFNKIIEWHSNPALLCQKTVS